MAEYLSSDAMKGLSPKTVIPVIKPSSMMASPTPTHQVEAAFSDQHLAALEQLISRAADRAADRAASVVRNDLRGELEDVNWISPSK